MTGRASEDRHINTELLEVFLRAFRVGFVAIVIGGCSTTHYVTPWLRLNRTYKPCLFADAGSSGCTHVQDIEVRKGSGWLIIPNGSYIESFCNKTRVILDRRIIDEQGHLSEIECKGLRVPAWDGKGLFCINTFTDEKELELFDCQGNLVKNMRMSIPNDSKERQNGFLGQVDSMLVFEQYDFSNHHDSCKNASVYSFDLVAKGWTRLGPSSELLEKGFYCEDIVSLLGLDIKDTMTDTIENRGTLYERFLNWISSLQMKKTWSKGPVASN